MNCLRNLGKSDIVSLGLNVIGKLRVLILFCLVIFMMVPVAFSQHVIKGVVIDSTANALLRNATVKVLNAKDSTLANFQWVTSEGKFNVDKLYKGKFILLVSYPEYADYVEHFVLDSLIKTRDFGRVNLIPRAQLLKEVMISGKITAIKLKGDTTEFNARAYAVQPNAKVEDLLKQLPGMQVSNDGSITAYGQRVNKVLVDGEEFFGDDPLLVTRNLRADMVDKIQLFDKKSDQAVLTGIDDGQKSKTINVILKEDKKKGYFGKVDLGQGSKEFYQAQGMFNLFGYKSKFSAYGNFANTGNIGLNSSNSSKYGMSSDNVTFAEVGAGIYREGSDEFSSSSGTYRGQGIPVAKSGAVHYDGKWNANKQSINTNFKLASVIVDGERLTLAENNLPFGIMRSNSTQLFNNKPSWQKADAVYQIMLDSTCQIKISADGTLRNGSKYNNNLSSSSREDGRILNSSERKLYDQTQQQSLALTAFYSKRFRKAGRSFSLSLAQRLNNNDVKTSLISENLFFDGSGNVSTENIDQYKLTKTKNSVFTSNATFSEAFSKYLSLVLNYGTGIDNSRASISTFNDSGSGNYDDFDPGFSNDYLFNQLSNQGGAMFNYAKNKQTIKFGTKAALVNFNQEDQLNSGNYERSFFYFYPQVDFRYQFSSQKYLTLNFSGSTVQPSIYQLQPVRVNTDPLNVTIGNPDLDPAFRSSADLSYQSYKPLNGQLLNLTASYSITNNPIASSVLTDTEGRNTYQAINIDGKNSRQINANLIFGRRVNFINTFVSLSVRMSNSSYFGLSNDELFKISDQVYTGGLNITKSKASKFDLMIDLAPSYRFLRSTLLNQLDNSGWGLTGLWSLNLYLPGKISISTKANYNYQAKTRAFDQNFETMIIDAAVSKRFLQKENIKISLSVNDLLNQNRGFRRNAYGNSIVQSTFTNIQRYFMCTLTWDFNKFGKINEKQ